jgi:hypothetical protein
MDPYLEKYWQDVHTSLMVYIRDHLQPQLPGDLVARVEEQVSIDVDADSRRFRPDVSVTEDFSASGSGGTAVMTAAIAEPLVVLEAEEPEERHIEILDVASGSRVVTAIEVLNPSNKLVYEGRSAYRQKQRAYLAGHVNLMEIDLVRQGEYVLAASLDHIPVSKRTPYWVCVSPARSPGRREVYPLPLRQRLPAIAIPLRPTDADVVLDLQQLIDQ